MISKDDFDIITKLDNGTPEYRDDTIKKHANQVNSSYCINIQFYYSTNCVI